MSVENPSKQRTLIAAKSACRHRAHGSHRARHRLELLGRGGDVG
jgi:hypothetical protein